MTFDHALLTLPPGWSFTHLIALEPSGFQCNLINPEDGYVVVATGANPGDAVAQAVLRTYNEKNYLSLYRPSDHAFDEGPPLTSIDIARMFIRREPINRRI